MNTVETEFEDTAVVSKVKKPAILIFVEDLADNLDEIKALIDTAQYDLKEIYHVPRRTLTTSYFITKERCHMIQDDLELKYGDGVGSEFNIIFGHKLTAKQHFNLEQEFSTENVLDKIELILQIFMLHSNSEEAKLQVKLINTQYRSQFEKMRVLNQLGTTRKGMVDYIGKGESLSDILENEAHRIQTNIKNKLEEIKQNRAERRKRRLSKPDVLTIGLAGYTCSGKSTFLNNFTESHTRTDSSLFTTVGTRSRQISVADIDVVVTDTVGFVENLPAFMIEAFSSTLEEIVENDVILLVIDGSEPFAEIQRKIKTTLDVFNKLKVDDKKIYFCMNKIDLVPTEDLDMLTSMLKERYPYPIIKVSALEKQFNEVWDIINTLYPEKEFLICSKDYEMLDKLNKFLYNNSIVIEKFFKNQSVCYKLVTRMPSLFQRKFQRVFPQLDLVAQKGN